MIVRNLFLLSLIWIFSETAQAQVYASTLPASRSVQTGHLAAIFATIINAGTDTANNCQVQLATSVDADFYYQITDPFTNAPLGEPNTPVDIAAGQAQSFVLALRANSEVAPVDVNFDFVCDNSDPAPVVPGLNTLLFSASDTPVPDIIALSATLNGNGITDLPSGNQLGFFSVATINLGVSATIRVTTDATGEGVSNAFVCETNPRHSCLYFRFAT